MNIRLKEFKEKLHRIYLRDFPESERMPYYMIKKYYKNKKIKILALKDERRNIVAYSMITEHNGYILLLYLAVLKDKRENGTPTNYEFVGELSKKQEKAMNELLKHDIGVLCATTGFGKTVIGAKIISKLKTNTLVIVNRNKNYHIF